eukprot:CAMPEP_0119048112 /NCGR_PEP_ID=MMETSP1177-20130426/56968_1 /TAXON_ID=2985 /ORGANISM="Ochromonas sp, Strain CCMP1899" /LENGTH=71 /DNA_ID=CAMNT_0007023549 /DNA_START=179 /DNA_END=391 /DNA_ORIENTATION=-
MKMITKDAKNKQAALNMSKSDGMFGLYSAGDSTIMPHRLQEDIDNQQIDTLMELSLLENEQGYTERSISLI